MIIAIKNGNVYDGLGNPPSRKNILIRGDRIIRIDDAPIRNADVTIDALGAFVMPGFIDIGSYADKTMSIFSDPSQKNVVQEGITTQIIGNDGTSLVPFSPHSLELTRSYASHNETVHNWRRVKDFLLFFSKRKIGTNIGVLVGLSTTRSMFTRGEARDLTEKELDFCENVLRESFRDGALGFSIEYDDNGYIEKTSHNEAERFISIAAKAKCVYAAHLPRFCLSRALEDTFLNLKDENTNLELSYARPFINQIEAYSETAEFMEKLSGKTYAHFDLNPFGESTVSAEAFLPQWARGKTRALTLDAIFSPGTRERLEEYFKTQKDNNLVIGSVVDASLRFLEGKTLQSFARNAGKSYEKGIMEFFRITKLRAHLLCSECEFISNQFINHHQIIFSWGRSKNARSGPLEFLKFAEKGKFIVLEKAIEKMTSLPAKKFGIAKRGILAQGNYADIVVARDFQATNIFINGKRVVGSGVEGSLFGRVLKNL